MTLCFNYWTLASFLIVIFTAPMWPAMPGWIWLAPIIGLLLLAMKLRALRVLVGFCLASAVILVHGNILIHQTNELFKAEPDIIINAEVDSFFKQISHGFQGRVVVRSINGQRLNSFEQPAIWLVSPIRLNIGDTLTSRVVLKPITGLMNDVGFDAEKYAFAKGIVAKAAIQNSTSFYVVNDASWRQILYDRVSQQTTQLVHKGLISALLFGVRDDIPTATWESLQNAGLSHLVAISGLHIGIVFGVGWLLGRVLLRVNPHFFYAPVVIALSFAITYAWLAGFSIPTRRALMMCALFSLLQFSARYLPLLLKWILVLVVILTCDPFSILDVSLWMSMSAVAIIFIYLSLVGRERSRIRSAIEIQCFIVILMSPLVASLFNGVSLGAILFNLLFVPWFSLVIIPLTFFSLILTICSASDNLVWQSVDWALDIVVYLASFAHVTWYPLSNLQSSLVLLSVLLVCSALVLNKRAVALAALIGLVVIHDWREKPIWELFILDVGHGLSVVAIQNGKALVYDTGASWGESGIAQQVLLPFLQAKGINTLDVFVVSHFDNDHAGGWMQVQEAMSPRTFLSSQEKSGNRACVAGQTLGWGNVQLEVLWPPKVVPRAYNPQSCVIKFTSPKSPYSVLLPGDVDAIAEWLLLREKYRLDADVLLVPHHGSQTSSRPLFIEAVSPDYAIASTAKVGRWNLPNELVIARYKDSGSKWQDTGTSGQISFKFYPTHYEVETLRESKGRAWYRQMLRKGVE